jgi:hypothetical protein
MMIPFMYSSTLSVSRVLYGLGRGMAAHILSGWLVVTFSMMLTVVSSANDQIAFELPDPIELFAMDALQHGFGITAAQTFSQQLGSAVAVADVNGDGLKYVSFALQTKRNLPFASCPCFQHQFKIRRIKPFSRSFCVSIRTSRSMIQQCFPLGWPSCMPCPKKLRSEIHRM